MINSIGIILRQWKAFVLLACSFVLFAGIHISMQSDNFLIQKIANYENIEGQISHVKKPYGEVTHQNLLSWDGRHYYTVGHIGYSKEELYLFAFFPLFPKLWAFTGLSAVGIALFNAVLFALSVFLLWYYFSKSRNLLQLFLLVNMPFISPFIIPYTESLFFFSITIALIGYVREQYWLYAVGAAMAGATRSAITIILLTLIVSEALYFVRSKTKRETLKRFIFALLPLLVGTLGALFYQKISGAESLLTYIDAIQVWDRHFRIPTAIRDWSAEGFGLNLSTILIFLPICLIIIGSYFAAVFTVKAKAPFLHQTVSDKYPFLLLVASVYSWGMFATIFFFQNGSLNGTFRYILCTPFFYFVILYFNNICHYLTRKAINSYFAIAFLLCILAFIFLQYSSGYSFSYLGFPLFFLSVYVALHIDHFRTKTSYALFGILLLLNIFWNTYMFNCFVENAWIFT